MFQLVKPLKCDIAHGFYFIPVQQAVTYTHNYIIIYLHVYIIL